MPVARRLMLIPALLAVVRSTALTCIVLGTAVLLGWAFDIGVLTSVVPGLPTMKANTASCFALCGISLLAWRQLRVQPGVATGTLRALAIGCGALVLLVSAVTLSQDLLDWNSGLDEALLRVEQPSDTAPPGRMSTATALLFVLCGGALLLFSGGKFAVGWGQGAAATSLFAAMVAVLGYGLESNMARIAPFSSMAINTAVGFAVLAIGLLALRGDESWISVFLQDTPSARASLLYLAGAVVVLPLTAVLSVIGHRRLAWYDPIFGSALLAALGIAMLATLTWLSTRTGNVADRKIRNHQRVHATLSGINTLIVRVHDRQVLFDEACRIAAEKGHFPSAWIATIDPSQESAQVVAWNGNNPALATGLHKRLDLTASGGRGNGLLRQVMHANGPVIVDDISDLSKSADHEVERTRELLDAGIRSLVALPLKVAGSVVGVFVLHAERTGFFDDAEMDLLKELAGDISFAINHIDKEAELNFLAFFDPLTGLPNRALFMERLGRQLQESGRRAQKVVLLLGNLRRFRLVNDTFGRNAGDELLKQMAVRLRSSLRYPENLARLDGDSFASFLPGGGLVEVRQRVQDLFAKVLGTPFRIDEQDLKVDVTLAAAVFPQDGTDGETLMSNAETALRKGQAAGEPFMYYESEMNAKVADLVKLEFQLRQALELGQFELHYQPKVDFERREVRSVEALMRWRHPEMGLVPPGQFIPLMEEIGLIAQAGTWAMRQAVADICRWRSMGLSPPRCAVNISVVQLRDSDFFSSVVDALARFGDDPPMLDIEITESMIMQDVGETSRILQMLRGVGVDIAIDDFGTGYSSLAYLARLPINSLKVDRSFVHGMDSGEQGVMIVGSIISLAHSLRLVVVAEGVETEEQAAILRGMRCDLMQGFLISKAVPFDELAAMLPKSK
ncbi:MAG: GGDEF domain-containing protein [Rhodoferax sp.]|nr:GGDEF domain-containing protein [Rhodoferax sp.]